MSAYARKLDGTFSSSRLLAYHLEEGHHGVDLYKKGPYYLVVYGEQETEYLNMYEAAQEYAECIIHTLTCAGKLD